MRKVKSCIRLIEECGFKYLGRSEYKTYLFATGTKILSLSLKNLRKMIDETS